MSATNPNCYGCLVNPNWFSQHKSVVENFNTVENEKDTTVTTLSEKEILLHLATAWNKFVELSDMSDHDLREFNYAIHLAQQKIAVRIARRADPLIWRKTDVEVQN